MRSILFVILLSVFLTPLSFGSESTSFFFEPSQLDVNIGDEFAVDIGLYSFSDSRPISSADVWIQYDPKHLQPIVEGDQNRIVSNLFDEVGIKPFENKVYLYGVNELQGVSQTAGVVGNIHFKALQEGKTSLLFDCAEGVQQTSQLTVFSDGFENTLNCISTRNHSAEISIGPNSSVLGASIEDTSVSDVLLFGSSLLVIGLIGIVLMKRFTFQKHPSHS